MITRGRGRSSFKIFTEFWGARRLTTRGTDLRPLLVTATGVCVLLVAAVTYAGMTRLSDRLPLGGVSVVPGYGAVAALAIPATQLAIAVAAACLAAAVIRAGAVVHWLTRIFIAFKGIDWGVEVLFSLLGLNAWPDLAQRLGLVRTLVVAVSLVAVACAVAVIGVPRSVVRRHRWLLPVLAAAPFASYLVLFAIVGTRDVPTVGSVSLGPGTIGFPAHPSVATWLSFWTMNQVSNLSWALIILTWWLIHEAVRGARDVGQAVALRAGGASQAVLVALLAAKGLLWGGSCAGALPEMFGEVEPVCSEVAGDGLGSIVLACALTCGAAIWLIRRQDVETRRAGDLLPAGMLLIAALSLLPFLVYTSIRLDQIVRKATLGLADGKIQTELSNLFDGPRLIWSLFCVVVAATALGLRLLGTRWWGAGVLFVAFAVWNGVRTIAVSVGLVQYDWAPLDLSVWSEAFSQHPGWVSLLTIDAAVTIAVVVAAFVLRRSANRDLVYRNLVVVVLASTLITHTGHFQPPLFQTPALAMATVVFPIVYTLMFDAEWVIAERHRTARVAGVLALSLMVLGVLIVSLESASAGAFGNLAKEMLAIPVLCAVLIVEMVWRVHGEHAAPAPGGPPETDSSGADRSPNAVRAQA